MHSHHQGHGNRASSELAAPPTPEDMAPINVEGRHPLTADQGFGKKWEKTYEIRLAAPAPSPEAVMEEWKARFEEFWPDGSRFHLAGHDDMPPGHVAAAEVKMPAGLKLATGLVVTESNDRSFTLVTAEGHMFAGTIVFSAFAQGDATFARVRTNMRCSDPIYELGFLLGGDKLEDRFWGETYRHLAARFGKSGVKPRRRVVLMDPARKWRNAKNTWYNAGVRTTIYRVATPLRWLWDRRAGERESRRGSA
ncbi:MAG: hypothetical protein ABI305_04460 [Tepidiformaceae bacterium]